MNEISRVTKSSCITSALVLLSVLGCSDASDSKSEGVTGSGPAYLLGTRVWDDTTITSYFHVSPSIESDTEIAASRALEVAGSAKLFGALEVGWFAIGGGEAPTITRYTLDDDGLLEEGDSISLQDYGVESLWDTVYIVSKTKAYYPDRANNQLIVWNPSAMEVSGSIELPETKRDGYLSLYGYAPIMRDHLLLISVGWFDWEENDSVLAETGLVQIDTETDSVVGFETDERCGGITQPITTASGDTYLVSSALAGAAHRLDRLSTKPCALRVRADQTSLDADYLQELAVLTDGSIAGEPIPAGENAIFLRVLDESLASIEDESLTWELTGQSAWRWARWQLGTTEVEAIDSLEPSTSDVVWFQVDGRAYGTETTTDYAETTLIDLSAESGPIPALTAPGFVHGVTRIR